MPLQGLKAATGVDALSHKKKAVFWRELIGLFPNMIDYLCNPDVDPVRSLSIIERLLQTGVGHGRLASSPISFHFSQEPLLEALDGCAHV
jgi:hypothetical protein